MDFDTYSYPNFHQTPTPYPQPSAYHSPEHSVWQSQAFDIIVEDAYTPTPWQRGGRGFPSRFFFPRRNHSLDHSDRNERGNARWRWDPYHQRRVISSAFREASGDYTQDAEEWHIPIARYSEITHHYFYAPFTESVYNLERQARGHDESDGYYRRCDLSSESEKSKDTKHHFEYPFPVGNIPTNSLSRDDQHFEQPVTIPLDETPLVDITSTLPTTDDDIMDEYSEGVHDPFLSTRGFPWAHPHPFEEFPSGDGIPFRDRSDIFLKDLHTPEGYYTRQKGPARANPCDVTYPLGPDPPLPSNPPPTTNSPSEVSPGGQESGDLGNNFKRNQHILETILRKIYAALRRLSLKKKELERTQKWLQCEALRLQNERRRLRHLQTQQQLDSQERWRSMQGWYSYCMQEQAGARWQRQRARSCGVQDDIPRRAYARAGQDRSNPYPFPQWETFPHQPPQLHSYAHPTPPVPDPNQSKYALERYTSAWISTPPLTDTSSVPWPTSTLLSAALDLQPSISPVSYIQQPLLDNIFKVRQWNAFCFYTRGFSPILEPTWEKGTFEMPETNLDLRIRGLNRLAKVPESRQFLQEEPGEQSGPEELKRFKALVKAEKMKWHPDRLTRRGLGEEETERAKSVWKAVEDIGNIVARFENREVEWRGRED